MYACVSEIVCGFTHFPDAGCSMTWAHIHLALNHVPVIGLPIALLVLGWALVRRSTELTRTSFGLLVLLAIVTLLVQLTGEPAEDLIEGLPGVLESAIERHEEAAMIGTIGMTALGLLAFLGLWKIRAGRALSRWFSPVVLLGGVLLAGYFVWVANLGGQIRHSEIRPTTALSQWTGRTG
jgi:uncharacterized membrane protein